MFQSMDRRSWVHFFRGYLSAFSLFPVLPPLKIEPPHRRRTAGDGPFVKVGESLRWAMGQVRDEAERSEGSGDQQPPR